MIEDLSKHLGGVILFEETVDQKTSSGMPFTQLLNSAGILSGIKLDKVHNDAGLFLIM